MATNQMRREAAKRKLANQQKRRAERARRRQRIAIFATVGLVMAVVIGLVVVFTIPTGGGDEQPAAAPGPGDCTFTPTPNEPASRPAPLPAVTTASTTGTVAVALQTDRGAIPLTLDRSTGPCTVESLVSLVNAGFYNDTPCHRLTTTDGLRVLQCGDPSGTGGGGPGYTVNDEPPTTLAPAAEPGYVIYPRGMVAMARPPDTPNSTGSQFFLVYGDSTLTPEYTVVGTIGEEGLATIDAIAQGGQDDSNRPGDGRPNTPVTIQTATVG